MTTHYTSSSRGPVEIATMNYNHAINAHDKLMREDKDGERKAELEALRAHLATLAADEAEAEANG